MKFFNSLVMLASCSVLAYCESTDYSRNPINNILLAKIEEVRKQMPCGINGGPGLVPFELDFLDIGYNFSRISTKGFLRDIQVQHLNEFAIDNIDFQLLRLQLDFSVRLPVLTFNGEYNASAEYLSKIKFWGAGPFSVTFNDLELSGMLRLRIASGHLDMTELKSVLSLKSLNSRISGILGLEQYSELFNRLLEEMIPEMLVKYSNEITDLISEYLMPIANKYLHELTLSDIIGGGSGTDKECIV